MPEAKVLQQALHESGVSAFLCDIPEGQDLANAVVTALTHCKLAVILGTKSYGKKTTSGFSTFEELRYIINEQKPLFLVKMCSEFDEAETRFRLSTDISYFQWQPSSKAEREQLPPGLLERVLRRLLDVLQGHAGYAAPPVAPMGVVRRTGVAHAHGGGAGVALAATMTPPAVIRDLGQWLQSLQLDEFEPVLRKLGAVDPHDVRDGFAVGDITKEMLVAEGLKSLRITRLQREASKVRLDGWRG
jgi:hypothetical protein